MSSPPEFVKVGYVRVKVSPFVPSPLRCFKCQRFGHSSRACRGQEICRDCGQKKHDGSCTNAVFCVNCKGDHSANSKSCPVWKKECEIQKVKIERKCSFPEARRLVEVRTPSAATYAQKVVNDSENRSSGDNLGAAPFTTLERKLTEMLSSVLDRLTVLERSVEILSQKCNGVTSGSVQQASVPAGEGGGVSVVQGAVDQRSGVRDRRKEMSPRSQAKGSSAGRARSEERPFRTPDPPKGKSRSQVFGAAGFSPIRANSKHGNKQLRNLSGASASDLVLKNRFSSLVDSEVSGEEG